jgi:hypothetical protein
MNNVPPRLNPNLNLLSLQSFITAALYHLKLVSPQPFSATTPYKLDPLYITTGGISPILAQCQYYFR